MRITWEIEDGYIGKSRPHFTEVDDEDLDECETEDEREELISEIVHQDFLLSVTWSETSREE